MKNYRLITTIVVLIFIWTAVCFGQTLATLTMPDTTAALGDIISIPIKVSTTSNIGLAQFVVEFDSTIIKFQNAVIGKDGGGFLLSQNPNLPFPVTSTQTNENVLIQISGGGSGFFSGQDKEVVILIFDVKASYGKSPLVFDQTSNHTFLTATSLSDIAGSNIMFEDGEVDCNPTAINKDNEEILPEDFVLYQNYPNPFNPETEIRFQAPKSSNVVINIYNILGENICTLVNAQYEKGHHSVIWDGKDKFGNDVTSGIYLYKLDAGGFSQTKKMHLIR